MHVEEKQTRCKIEMVRMVFPNSQSQNDANVEKSVLKTENTEYFVKTSLTCKLNIQVVLFTIVAALTVSN